MNLKLKLETSLDFFLLFIILVKIVFFVSAVGHLILSHSVSDRAKNVDPKLVELKGYTEFIFMIAMAILMLYHFNPYIKRVSVDEESRMLFFLFGWILILTANWSMFFSVSPLYKSLANSFS